MNEISFTAAANLTADPELRYTPSARPVANLRLAINSRRRSAEGAWVDAPTTYLDAPSGASRPSAPPPGCRRATGSSSLAPWSPAPGPARMAPSDASSKSPSRNSARRCCSATLSSTASRSWRPGSSPGPGPPPVT